MDSRSLRRLVWQIRDDWEVHARDWSRPGFHAIAVHRFGAWVERELTGGMARPVLRWVHTLLFRFVRNFYGIELPSGTVLGRSVFIPHQSGIVIHANAVIGDECVIRQNVTIGTVSWERNHEAPTLGRGVRIGCGAAIVGPVRIGDGAHIGPNVVIVTDVPAGAWVFANAPRTMMMKNPTPAAGQEASEESGLRQSATTEVAGRLP